jgi:integrase
MGIDPVTGRKRQMSRTVKAKTVTAAREQMKGLMKEAGTQVTGTNATVRTLMAEWLEQLEADGKAPRTLTEHRRTVNQLVNPTLGDVPLRELTSRHVDLMNRKTASLAPTSRRRYHAVLSAALNQAVKWGWIDINPALRANAPKIQAKVLVPPTRSEVAQLVEAMPAEVWRVALKLAVLTGMRRGELCALRWSDIDRGVIRVRRSVYRQKGETVEKGTKGGRERWITLDPITVGVLKTWGERRQHEADDPGIAISSDSFVLSTWPDGSRPVNPDTLSAHVTRAAKDLGIHHVHLHSLRHFAATEMLAGGIGVRDVAEVLGHADGGRLALQVYGHATDDRQRAAAAAMAAVLAPPADDCILEWDSTTADEAGGVLVEDLAGRRTDLA